MCCAWNNKSIDIGEHMAFSQAHSKLVQNEFWANESIEIEIEVKVNGADESNFDLMKKWFAPGKKEENKAKQTSEQIKRQTEKSLLLCNCIARRNRTRVI